MKTGLGAIQKKKIGKLQRKNDDSNPCAHGLEGRVWELSEHYR